MRTPYLRRENTGFSIDDANRTIRAIRALAPGNPSGHTMMMTNTPVQ